MALNQWIGEKTIASDTPKVYANLYARTSRSGNTITYSLALKMYMKGSQDYRYNRWAANVSVAGVSKGTNITIKKPTSGVNGTTIYWPNNTTSASTSSATGSTTTYFITNATLSVGTTDTSFQVKFTIRDTGGSYSWDNNYDHFGDFTWTVPIEENYYVSVDYKPGGGSTANYTKDGTTYYTGTTSGYLYYTTDSSDKTKWSHNWRKFGSAKDPTNRSTFGLTKTGHSFSGWTNSVTGALLDQNTDYTAQQMNPSVDTQNCSTHLTATWTPNIATIHYYANGGTGKGNYTLDSSNRAVTSSGDLVATKISYGTPSNVYDVSSLFSPPTGHHTPTSSTDYYDSGWRVGSGTATTYATQGTYDADSHITSGNATVKFYARWLKNVATIHYYANGGTAKSGYALDSSKRATNSSGTLIATSISYGTPANVYDVSTLFSPPTGYHTPVSSTDYYDTGWRVGSGTATTYATQGTYNADSHITSGNATVKFYARWLNNTYTVSYNGNGYTGGSTASSSHTYDVAKALTKNGFTRAYKVTYNANGGNCSTTSATATYSFKNWNKNAAGTSTSYTNQQSVSNLTATDGGTVTLYAQWNSASVTLPTPTRTGYTFKGWYTAASGGTKAGGAGDSYTPTAAITLYAQWTANTYTVTFNATGGSVSPTSKSVTYDSTYETLPTPTKEGYEFLGWYTAETGGSQITSSTTVKITANQTLYAHWDPLGLVRIWNGSSFQLAIPYIYNGGWQQAMGYIYKNSTDKWQFGI